MTTEFFIRQLPAPHSPATCPICGLEFSQPYLGVYQDDDRPICDLCAWEKAPGLANLLLLDEAAEGYTSRRLPAQVREALTQRQNDPARLKNELQGVLESLDLGGMSLLKKLVAEQITAALKCEDVKTMQQAKRLHEECGKQLAIQDDLPF